MVSLENPDLLHYATDQVATRLGKLVFEVRRASQAMDAETIHDLRVAVRRFQQSLTVFETLLPMQKAKKIRARLKRLMDLAGEVRDRDIACQLLEKTGVPANDPLWSRVADGRQQAERDLKERIKRWNRKNFSAKWRTWLQLDRP